MFFPGRVFKNPVFQKRYEFEDTWEKLYFLSRLAENFSAEAFKDSFSYIFKNYICVNQFLCEI